VCLLSLRDLASLPFLFSILSLHLLSTSSNIRYFQSPLSTLPTTSATSISSILSLTITDYASVLRQGHASSSSISEFANSPFSPQQGLLLRLRMVYRRPGLCSHLGSHCLCGVDRRALFALSRLSFFRISSFMDVPLFIFLSFSYHSCIPFHSRSSTTSTYQKLCFHWTVLWICVALFLIFSSFRDFVPLDSPFFI